MKPNNNIKALKSGVWYTLSSFLVKCMGFITTPIFARLLTKGEYGEFSNFLSWMNIAITLVGLHIESSLISARYEYEDKLKLYEKRKKLDSIIDKIEDREVRELLKELI